MQRFEARVEPHGKTATFFHVPPDVVEALGPKKRVAVRVTVNGHTYRSTVAPMGGEYLLPLNRENRSAAGVTAGDVIEVVLERDDEPASSRFLMISLRHSPPTASPRMPSRCSRTATSASTSNG